MTSGADPGSPADLPDLPPYQVVRRVGTGGMGEVFLARDDRLRRHVAVKRLRPDRDSSPAERERLRREARFAARLSHPAIVQIHDVLERDGRDYLVMEWIDGETLHHRLQREGPLPIEDVVELARQIAGGLAEAHRRGIVHRDLKAENVLVDDSGRAKITDFGIAKRLPTGRAGSSIFEESQLEESLTGASVVLGTYRSMSPEQALAEPIGPRSDLFSLGTLLYEMLTGRSPFEGKGALDTLRRVVEYEPRPVDALRPETPPALAELVLWLLRKEPDLRPRSAAEVERALDLGTDEVTLVAGRTPRSPPRERDAARPFSRPILLLALGLGLALVLALAAIFRPGFRGPPSIDSDASPLYVAAMAPEIRVAEGAAGETDASSRRDLETFAEAVRVAAVRGLVALDGVSAKATEEIDRAEGDPLQIAASVAADEIVTPSILYRPLSARITLTRVRASDGVVQTSASFDVPTDDLLLVSRAVAARVRAAYPGKSPRSDTPGLDVRPEDLRRFLEVRRAFQQRDDPVGDSLLEDLARLRESSPDFFDIDLLEAQVALYRFHDSRDPDHLERARRAVERARSKAPSDPRALRQAFEVERRAGRMERAEAILDQLAEVSPGDVQILDLRARLLRSQGRAGDALATMREAVERQPSLDRLVDLARLEIELGEIAAARENLRASLDRSPDYFEALSLLAQLELGAGDPAVAADLYARLVEREAGTSELSNLGVARMLLGDYSEAAEHFQEAFEAEPRNPFFALNLADALLLADESEAASELYETVVELVDADSAADEAQFHTVRAQALAHLGRSRDAITTLQKALAQAPENANVAYEAALVYSLVGERTSALVQAEAAIDRGIDRRWFDFPWFDDLHEDEAFRAALDRRH